MNDKRNLRMYIYILKINVTANGIPTIEISQNSIIIKLYVYTVN